MWKTFVGPLSGPTPAQYGSAASRMGTRRTGLRALCGAVLIAAALADPSSAAAQQFSGTGQHATNFFERPAGLAVVELSHMGEGEFRVRLMDARGRPLEVLAHTRGVGQMTRALRIPSDGNYLFDIEASGAWEIHLREGHAAFREAEMVELGRADGARAARSAGGARWMGLGLAGGVLLGPLGGGGVFALAGARPAGEPPPLPPDAAALGNTYRDAYLTAYRTSVASERRTAALVGGLIGSAANAMLLFNFARGRQGEDGDGPPVTPEFHRAPAGFLRFSVPWPGYP
jgi:hypothetical protein